MKKNKVFPILNLNHESFLERYNNKEVTLLVDKSGAEKFCIRRKDFYLDNIILFVGFILIMTAIVCAYKYAWYFALLYFVFGPFSLFLSNAVRISYVKKLCLKDRDIFTTSMQSKLIQILPTKHFNPYKNLGDYVSSDNANTLIKEIDTFLDELNKATDTTSVYHKSNNAKSKDIVDKKEIFKIANTTKNTRKLNSKSQKHTHKPVRQLSEYIRNLNLEVQAYIDEHFGDDKIYCDKSPDVLYQIIYDDSDLGPSFSQTLFKFIKEKGISETDCYKNANVDRRLFSKIRSNKNYQPRKNTVFALIIGLKLNLDEAKKLLDSAGYSISHSIKQDLIMEYVIKKQIFDILQVNEILYSFDCPILGTK